MSPYVLQRLKLKTPQGRDEVLFHSTAGSLCLVMVLQSHSSGQEEVVSGLREATAQLKAGKASEKTAAGHSHGRRLPSRGCCCPSARPLLREHTCTRLSPHLPPRICWEGRGGRQRTQPPALGARPSGTAIPAVPHRGRAGTGTRGRLLYCGLPRIARA